jgi:hypothetical protein
MVWSWDAPKSCALIVVCLLFPVVSGCGSTERNPNDGSGAAVGVAGSSSSGGSSDAGKGGSGGSSAGNAGSTGNGGNTGSAGNAGSAGAVNPSGCPAEMPSGACTDANFGYVCPYLDEAGCPRALSCGGVEGSATIWHQLRIPFLLGSCETPGATCRYTEEVFMLRLFSEYSCSEEGVWEQLLCPPATPSIGDPCVGPASAADFNLQCEYDRGCVNDEQLTTIAQCTTCPAGTDCSFVVQGQTRSECVQ